MVKAESSESKKDWVFFMKKILIFCLEKKFSIEKIFSIKIILV